MKHKEGYGDFAIKGENKYLSAEELVIESFKKLLQECEPALKVEPKISSKWVISKNSKRRVREVKDVHLILLSSYFQARSKISKLPSFKACQLSFENDEVFETASRLAGAWSNFEMVLQDIIQSCGKIRRNRIIIDGEDVGKKISDIRKAFAESEVYFNVTARLLGVSLHCKEIILSNKMKLYNLSKKEINDRQPFLEPISLLSGQQQCDLLIHPAEVRISFNIPINRTEDLAFLLANNEASETARNAFNNVVDAILFVKEGNIELGPMVIKCGYRQSALFSEGSYAIMIPNLNVKIRKCDVRQIITAYKIISDKLEEKDNVIVFALRRFILGRKRHDMMDKLIDYVIAWESILLTNKKNQEKVELSYRFSINGASLINAINRNEDRKKCFHKMKSCYSLRSNIVHGNDGKKIENELRKGEFEAPAKACAFLENNFRAAVWWLMDIPRDERPYKKDDGWEELLWPCTCGGTKGKRRLKST